MYKLRPEHKSWESLAENRNLSSVKVLEKFSELVKDVCKSNSELSKLRLVCNSF